MDELPPFKRCSNAPIFFSSASNFACYFAGPLLLLRKVVTGRGGVVKGRKNEDETNADRPVRGYLHIEYVSA